MTSSSRTAAKEKQPKAWVIFQGSRVEGFGWQGSGQWAGGLDFLRRGHLDAICKCQKILD